MAPFVPAASVLEICIEGRRPTAKRMSRSQLHQITVGSKNRIRASSSGCFRRSLPIIDTEGRTRSADRSIVARIAVKKCISTQTTPAAIQNNGHDCIAGRGIRQSQGTSAVEVGVETLVTWPVTPPWTVPSTVDVQLPVPVLLVATPQPVPQLVHKTVCDGEVAKLTVTCIGIVANVAIVSPVVANVAIPMIVKGVPSFVPIVTVLALNPLPKHSANTAILKERPFIIVFT